MVRYSRIRFLVALKVFFALSVIWIPFSLFITPQTSRLNPYYVQQRMIQEKLYLIDQNDRGKRFAELIDLLKHVDSFRRREILQGPLMKDWFNKLMFREQAAIMEEIVPQPVFRFIRRFLGQPEEEQLAYLYRAGEMLLASNKVSANMRQQMGRYPAANFEEKKKMLREEISKYAYEDRYYKILQILFYKLNGIPNAQNSIEQAQVMILENIMTEEKENK